MRLLVWCTALAMCSGLAGGDDAGDQSARAIAAAEAGLKDAQLQEQTLRERLAADRQKLTEAQQNRFRAVRDVERFEADVKQLEPALAPKQEAAAAAAKTAQEAAAAAEAASQALQTAQTNPDATDEQKQAAQQAAAAAEEKRQAAAAASQAAAGELNKAALELASAKEQVEQAKAAAGMGAEEIARLQQEIGEREQQLAAASAARLETERTLQQALAAAGRWVSFAEVAAPIFHQRCLACHNARTAKGRYNMETYASILKGGESGAALTPGDREDSLLCIMVEDGSMPQDADPLTAEQIEIIGNWVAFGARLDPGVDPQARLIEVMPLRPQPAAPAVYPAPIPVTAAAFSPDGETLATSGYREVLLWSAGDGGLRRRIGNVAERVYGLDFSPDGGRIAVAAGTPGRAGEIKVFDAASGELLANLVKAEDAMFGVAFSPDGTRLAACGADRMIRVFNAADWKEITRIEDHADWVLAVAWSPDGKQLASASRDKTSKLFDAATGDGSGTFNSHGETVYDVAFLPDGKLLATCGGDKQVRIWKGEDAKEARRIGGFGGEVLALSAAPDGRLAAAGADGSVKVHQSSDGKQLQSLAGSGGWVYSVALHAGSQRAAAGSFDGRVRIWNLADGKTLAEWTAVPPAAE